MSDLIMGVILIVFVIWLIRFEIGEYKYNRRKAAGSTDKITGFKVKSGFYYVIFVNRSANVDIGALKDFIEESQIKMTIVLVDSLLGSQAYRLEIFHV